jgi:predicted Zn-dependent protease with MMP-like domain
MSADTLDWSETLPPDLAVIDDFVRATINALPAPFRDIALGLGVNVMDFAPDDLLEEMGVEDPFELTGLYTGLPLTEKSVGDQPDSVDAIWLFRRPILDEWTARGDVALGHLVAHVTLHELAHHFGWSDDDIAQIAPWEE